MSNSKYVLNDRETERLNYKAFRFAIRHNITFSTNEPKNFFIRLSMLFVHANHDHNYCDTLLFKQNYKIWRRIIARQLMAPELNDYKRFEPVAIQWHNEHPLGG